MKLMDTYMPFDRSQQRTRACQPPKAESGRDDLAEAVEPQHPPDLPSELLFKGEVRERARQLSVVQEMVRVVLEDDEIVLSRELEDLDPSGLACRYTSRVRPKLAKSFVKKGGHKKERA